MQVRISYMLPFDLQLRKLPHGSGPLANSNLLESSIAMTKMYAMSRLLYNTHWIVSKYTLCRVESTFEVFN